MTIEEGNHTMNLAETMYAEQAAAMADEIKRREYAQPLVEKVMGQYTKGLLTLDDLRRELTYISIQADEFLSREG